MNMEEVNMGWNCWHAINSNFKSALWLMPLVVMAGCASIGPATVSRDRFDYVASISDSWKRQMLQNLLKIRYSDAPVFLDVTSVINSYELTNNTNFGGQLARTGQGDTFVGISDNVGYADRPTITYTPLSGDKFARSLMAPLPISGILYLLQAGYPADAVLRLCVNSINGLNNAYGGPGSSSSGDAQFSELLRQMLAAQSTGALGVTQKTPKDKESAVLTFHRSNEDGADSIKAIEQLLDLDPQAREFDVIYGSHPSSKTEIAIVSRSTLQIMADFASYIDVPAADVAEGRVYAPTRSPELLRLFPQYLRVRNGAAPPADAYVAAKYRNTWFWVDDRDVQSKTALTFLMLLFSLTESGGAQAGAPVVTIPAR
jgi:hypothetical protein